MWGHTSGVTMEDMEHLKGLKKEASLFADLLQVAEVALANYEKEMAYQEKLRDDLHAIPLTEGISPLFIAKKKRSALTINEGPSVGTTSAAKKRPAENWSDERRKRPAEDWSDMRRKDKVECSVLDKPNPGPGPGPFRRVELKKKKKNRAVTNKTLRPRIEINNGPSPPPEMPPDLQNRIGAMGGSDISLVIQKGLFATDVNDYHNRLSIPFRHVVTEFLTEEEKASLDVKILKKKAGITMLIIDENLREYTVGLKRWDMKKENGSVSSMYALISSWATITQDNDLREGTVIQLWSFRGVNREPCFALVKL